MAAPLPTSMQQNTTGNNSNTMAGNFVEHQHHQGTGTHHHHRHHGIARVASAHGPRDSILSFKHYSHRQQQQQQPQSSQPQHYHRHQSPSPLVTNSGGGRLLGGSAPPALCPGAIAIPPPPQYEQAVAAAAAASVGPDNEDDQNLLSAGNAGMGKFSSRRSPESRTPVQAVLPMQPSIPREVIPSPTSIPDECQVVKQLVREMAASGKLPLLGNSSSGYNSDRGSSVSQALPAPQAMPPPPPAYHQPQHLQQQPIRQQQIMSSQHQKPLTAPYQHHGPQGPLTGSTTSATPTDPPHVIASRQAKDSSGSHQRLSLSHPDLSRLQNLHLSPWQASGSATDADEGGTAMAQSMIGPAVLQNVAGMTTSPTAVLSQNPLIKAQQRAMQEQQQLQQLQQAQHVNVNVGQQNLSGKLAEYGVSFPPSFSSSMVGASALGNRVPYPQTHQLPPGVSGSMAYQQAEMLFQTIPSNSAVQTPQPRSVNAAVGSLVPGPEYAHQQYAQDSYEADLEANAFTRMMNLLKDENKKLRSELDTYMKKTFKLQQLELQYQRIHREYEDLVQRQEKREELEQQMENRMRQENARLRDLNVHLRDQLENTMAQVAHLHADESEDAEMRHELVRREMMMAQLITQNKELVACKERQEIELDAQRQTLDDQREHIQVLDRALINVQERNLRVEEECKRKLAYVERAEQLERTVKLLQQTVQKNEDNHKRIRAQLEKELAQLQLQKKDTQVKKTSSSRCLQEFDETLAKLKRELRDKEDQVTGLQQEAVKWQNLYYEEAKKRQTAMDEAVDSKDARIRILEETSDKAEKMVESARVESKRYLDDLRSANSKVTELQTKVENLTARLAEKDAMINVLRRHQNAPFGDTSISARSAEATLSEPFNPHETKQRLDAVRRRLLQSPSPSRYTPRLYQRHGHKYTSIDATFGLDSNDYGSLGRVGRRGKTLHACTSSVAFNGAKGSSGTDIAGAAECSGGRVQHNRTQSSCETYLSPFSGSAGTATSSALNAFKQREIFTLPTRRSRTKLLVPDQVKSLRPRSADEHLLNRPESLENADEGKPDAASCIAKPSSSIGLDTPSSGTVQTDNEENGEELWHV